MEFEHGPVPLELGSKIQNPALATETLPNGSTLAVDALAPQEPLTPSSESFRDRLGDETGAISGDILPDTWDRGTLAVLGIRKAILSARVKTYTPRRLGAISRSNKRREAADVTLGSHFPTEGVNPSRRAGIRASKKARKAAANSYEMERLQRVVNPVSPPGTRAPYTPNNRIWHATQINRLKSGHYQPHEIASGLSAARKFKRLRNQRDTQLDKLEAVREGKDMVGRVLEGRVRFLEKRENTLYDRLGSIEAAREQRRQAIAQRRIARESVPDDDDDEVL